MDPLTWDFKSLNPLKKSQITTITKIQIITIGYQWLISLDRFELLFIPFFVFLIFFFASLSLSLSLLKASSSMTFP